MLPTLLFLAAIAAAPVVLVLATLALLGALVATFADGVPNGLVRPNPS
ncbi:MAG TPA: hypothetical protein VH440_11295 [Candidatus Limnocylindrales bacterium]|jgi:hypothetical protein